MQIVPGYVIGSTLLHSMSINKVKLEFKEVKPYVKIIAIPESMRIKRVQLESAVYCLEKGKSRNIVSKYFIFVNIPLKF